MYNLDELSKPTGPIRSKPWPTYDNGNVFIDNKEAEAATRVIGSKLLFRYDSRDLQESEVGRFESSLCRFFGVRHALAVSSGTAALALSFMALGVGNGDEVLCSGFAFPASPSSILLAGARPVLVDVDENMHMDPCDLERKITSRTKAILVVHMRGQCGDLRRLVDLASARGLPLVEDAVPILGAKLDGRYLGTFGALGAFSTQSDKSLNTGEGGFILTNNTRLFERAIVLSGAYEGRLRKHCEWEPHTDELELPLYNFRMDELRGAIALSQLAKLPHRLHVLKRNYSIIRDRLSRWDEVILRQSHDSNATLGDSIIFRLRDSDAVTARLFTDALCSEGIGARCFGPLGRLNVRSYWNWKFLFPAMSTDQIRATLPRATYLLDRTVDIPLSPTLKAEDIEDLICAFGKALNRIRRLGPRLTLNYQVAPLPSVESLDVHAAYTSPVD